MTKEERDTKLGKILTQSLEGYHAVTAVRNLELKKRNSAKACLTSALISTGYLLMTGINGLVLKIGQRNIFTIPAMVCCGLCCVLYGADAVMEYRKKLEANKELKIAEENAFKLAKE